MKLFKRNPWITVATSYMQGTIQNSSGGQRIADVKIELQIKNTKSGYEHRCLIYHAINGDSLGEIDLQYVIHKEKYEGPITDAAKKYKLINL
jgi:hypothetical protein